MFERKELQELTKRIKEKRRFIQVVTGPRQVGKTTLVNQLLNKKDIDGVYHSADHVSTDNSTWLEQIWEAARFRVKSDSNDFVLVIDEIQKVSNWSEKVKKLWDEDTVDGKTVKVILSGSSSLLMQQGLTESLAGRFETIYLTHWSFREMKEAFGWDAETYAWFGGYPGSAELIEDENRWKAYIHDSLIETSISKDILMLTRVNKPALLRNLFELGSLYSGQVLSYNKIQGQLQDAGNTTTLSHYLALLSHAGLLSGIQKYSSATVRQRTSSPKFQIHNTALVSALDARPRDQVRPNPPEWGRVVESAVGAHLLNQSLKQKFSVYYWREGKDEVDFVLERNNQLIGLEIKSNYSRHQKGIKAFTRKFNPHKIYLVDEGGLPWYEFLKIDPVDLW